MMLYRSYEVVQPISLLILINAQATGLVVNLDYYVFLKLYPVSHAELNFFHSIYFFALIADEIRPTAKGGASLGVDHLVDAGR
jgi:hypothetical protein